MAGKAKLVGGKMLLVGGRAALNAQCCCCPEDATLTGVFSGVPDPSPAGCQPWKSLPTTFWFYAIALALNGGHALAKAGSPDWFLSIPGAFEFETHMTNDCSDGSPSTSTGDVFIQVQCNGTASATGKRFGLLVRLSIPFFEIYDLYNTLSDSTQWFNLNEVVELPGGGTFTLSVPVPP